MTETEAAKLVDDFFKVVSGGSFAALLAFIGSKLRWVPFRILIGKESSIDLRGELGITKTELDEHCKNTHDHEAKLRAQDSKIIQDVHSRQTEVLQQIGDIKDTLMDKLYDHEGRLSSVEGQIKRKAA